MSKPCTTLDYSLNLPAAPTVGVVVLQTDEVVEDELRHWLTPGTRILHTRIPNDQSVNAETLGAMEAALPHALTLLPVAAPIAVIAYGCTSGTTVIGEERVTQLVHEKFSQHGIDIVSFGSFNEPHDSNVCRIDDESLKNAITTLHNQAPCDAVFSGRCLLRLGLRKTVLPEQPIVPVTAHCQLHHQNKSAACRC